MNRLSLFDSAQAAPASHRQNLSHNGLVNPTHEPRPLTPSLSPTGGEGIRRTGEGDRHWIMVPMRGIKVVVAPHEPTHPRPLPGGEQAFVCVLSVPLLGEVRGGFMVPMHAQRRNESFDERQRRAGVPPA